MYGHAHAHGAELVLSEYLLKFMMPLISDERFINNHIEDGRGFRIKRDGNQFREKQQLASIFAPTCQTTGE